MSWVIEIKILLVYEHRASNIEESVSDFAPRPYVAVALGTQSGVFVFIGKIIVVSMEGECKQIQRQQQIG